MTTANRSQAKSHVFAIRNWMGALIYFLIYNVDELSYIMNILPSTDVLWKQSAAAAGEFFWRARSIINALVLSLARLSRSFVPAKAYSGVTKLIIMAGVIVFLLLPNHVMFFALPIKL